MDTAIANQQLHLKINGIAEFDAFVQGIGKEMLRMRRCPRRRRTGRINRNEPPSRKRHSWVITAVVIGVNIAFTFESFVIRMYLSERFIGGTL